MVIGCRTWFRSTLEDYLWCCRITVCESDGDECWSARSLGEAEDAIAQCKPEVKSDLAVEDGESERGGFVVSEDFWLFSHVN